MRTQNHKILAILLSVSLALFSGCSQKNLSSNDEQSSQEAPPADDDVPALPDHPDAYLPLAWEGTFKEAPKWSQMIFGVIQKEQTSLLSDSVQDVETFCPRYLALSDLQKTNFWGQLIVAMAKYESSWNPTVRFVEDDLGKDKVTQEQIASEGLLQVSYQDSIYHSAFCKFDWTTDKPLNEKNPRDARKTIFDPYKNLRCGLAILAKQIHKYHAITTDDGAYWSVIKSGNPHQKISQISNITKSLSFCQ